MSAQGPSRAQGSWHRAREKARDVKQLAVVGPLEGLLHAGPRDGRTVQCGLGTEHWVSGPAFHMVPLLLASQSRAPQHVSSAGLMSPGCLRCVPPRLCLASGPKGRIPDVGEFLGNKKGIPPDCGEFLRNKKVFNKCHVATDWEKCPFSLHQALGGLMRAFCPQYLEPAMDEEGAVG